jgi:hypothetical protein
MFYDFNKHQRLATSSPSTGIGDLSEKLRQLNYAARKRLSNKMGRTISRLPMRLQKILFLAVAGIGVGYCICLILPNSFLHQGEQSLLKLTSSHQTIQAAVPSPKQQAFEQYLDSLEKAFIADSIFQSQQTIDDHAEKSIHP